MKTIDISADIGEGFGNWRIASDAALMPLLTTAHVACGFHAGDPLTIQDTISLAQLHGVTVGAHPGLPDLQGFGRRIMRISAREAYAYVAYQAGALEAFLRPTGRVVSHVVPHGALYNLVKDDDALAAAVARAIGDVLDHPTLYYPAPRSAYALARECEKLGIPTVAAYYPDLAYTSRGELVVERVKKGADIELVKNQVTSILTEGYIRTVDGGRLHLEVQGIGLHGDGPNCVEVATAIRNAVEECQYIATSAVSGAPAEGPKVKELTKSYRK